MWYRSLMMLLSLTGCYEREIKDMSLRDDYGILARGGFVCVEVLRPGQPNRVMSSVVSLSNHTFTAQV